MEQVKCLVNKQYKLRTTQLKRDQKCVEAGTLYPMDEEEEEDEIAEEGNDDDSNFEDNSEEDEELYGDTDGTLYKSRLDQVDELQYVKETINGIY